MKFKASLFALLVAAVCAFAQEAASGDSTTQANNMAAQDSAARDAAFQDILGQNYTPDGYITALDSAVKDSLAKDSAQAESSSSEGGLVLYDAQSSSSSPIRHIGVDAPVYKYQVTVGLQSPSRGIVSLEYIFAQEIFNVNVHFSDYNSNLLQIGASAIYFPMSMRYFYTFVTSDWFRGKYDRERHISKGEYEDYEETVNYWRVVAGIGGEFLFLEHFGAYIEAGFEFFAGNGGYYTHLDKDHGTLDSDKIVLPYGFGLLFPF